MDSRETIINHLLRSTISNYVGRFIALGMWLLLTPFVLRHLETTLYGLWALIGSVTSYGYLLDFGISAAITKYVAEYRAKDQMQNARQLVGTALISYLSISAVVLLIFGWFAPIFPKIFNVPPENHSLSSWLVILAGIATALAIPGSSTTAVLRGLQRFDLMNLIGIVSTLLLAGGTVIVLLLGGGIIGYVVVGIAVNIVMLIPTIWVIHRIAPELHFGTLNASRAMFQKLSSFSSALFMVRIGGQLESKTDEIVIGRSLPVSFITPYSLAQKLSNFPQSLTDQFLTLLLPLASKLHAENEQSRIRSMYTISTRLTLAIFLPVGIGLLFLAGQFLAAWVGEEFAEYRYLVVILSLASMIDTSTWPAGAVLQGMGLPRFSGMMAMTTGISNLILSLILVRYMGLTGVALGTLIPTSVVCLGIVHPYTTWKIGITLRDLLRNILIPVLLPVAPASLAVYVLTSLIHPASIFSILAVGGCGFLIYSSVYLIMPANIFERDLIQSILRNILQRVKTYLVPSERSNP
jgi:O-antigen/teichoic acid export membrane protein